MSKIQTLPNNPLTMDDWIVQIMVAGGNVYTKGVSPNAEQSVAIASSINLLSNQEKESILSIKVKRRRDGNFRKVG